jgi:hypothetical protein
MSRTARDGAGHADLVTVAIDCRAGDAGLASTLVSLDRQDRPAGEVILVRQRGAHQPLELPVHDVTVREVVDAAVVPVHAETLGACAARYPWLLFLHPGDTLSPGFLG